MAYHRYVPDKGKSLPVFLQWAKEFFYVLESLLYAFVGIFISLPAPIGSSTDAEEGNVGKPPVVLVSGLLGRSLIFWRLRRALLKKGYHVYVPSFGFQLGAPSKKSRHLDAYLEAHNIENAFLVGHSMGGLIALNISLSSTARIRKLFLLSTPLKGTKTAYPFFFIPAFFEMLPNSKFLRTLENQKAHFISLQAIFPSADEVIFPLRSCVSGGMDDIQLQEAGHYNLCMGTNGIECLLLVMEEDIQREQVDSEKIIAIKNKKTAERKLKSRDKIKKSSAHARSEKQKSNTNTKIKNTRGKK